MLRLKRLVLTDFRSYPHLTWRPTRQIAVITGPNGTGKTNLLEAVSLLAPGRGLRGAAPGDMAAWNGGGAWAVAGVIQVGEAEHDIGSGLARQNGKDRRVFLMNGVKPRTQTDIATLFSTVWLTPQMDRLFTETAGQRRRFLDRLVWAAEPGHAREIAAHDRAMAGRNKLLSDGQASGAWIAGLEDSMARHAVAASAARRQLAAQLNGLLAAQPLDPFPAMQLAVADPIGDRLAEHPAVEVEDWLRRTLAQNRVRDAQAGGAQLGAHRADMILRDAASGQTADHASTGQQKTMLVGLMLAHAMLIERLRGSAPLLLLDEPAVHLDETRRNALFGALRKLNAQILITGTDRAAFEPLSEVAEGWEAGSGILKQTPIAP